MRDGVKVAFVAAIACGVAAGLCGCGASHEPLPDGRIQFPVAVTVEVAPNTLHQIEVLAAWPGNTFRAAGATATIERPDGSSGAMPFSVSGDRTTLTIGEAAVVPSASGGPTGLNVVTLRGPLTAVDGKTGAEAQVGALVWGFEVHGDGTVVAPTGLTFALPLTGSPRDHNVLVGGLQPQDFIDVRLRQQNGRVRDSGVFRAASDGSATIPIFGRVDARRFAGPDSSVTVRFGRTDANFDGEPDYFF